MADMPKYKCHKEVWALKIVRVDWAPDPGGLVTLHFVDRERRIEEGRTLFDQIVRTVEIAPELAYRPRLGDRWPGLPFFIAAAVMAAALLAFLVHRRRLKS